MTNKRNGEEFWSGHVRGWRSSGLTQIQYCERHRITRASLRYWIGRLHKKTDVLNFVPAERLPHTGAKVCVLRSAKGWEVEFTDAPSADYLSELLGGLR